MLAPEAADRLQQIHSMPFMDDGRRIILSELFFLSVLEHCWNVTLKWRPVYLLITLHGSACSHKMILMAETVLQFIHAHNYAVISFIFITQQCSTTCTTCQIIAYVSIVKLESTCKHCSKTVKQHCKYGRCWSKNSSPHHHWPFSHDMRYPSIQGIVIGTAISVVIVFICAFKAKKKIILFQFIRKRFSAMENK